MNILVKKLSDKAIIPTKEYGDAGFDLYSVEYYILSRMERKLFKTDIAMAIPQGCFGRVVDRSGNALKKGLHTMAGVIDSTYRGEIGVVLINLSESPVEIKTGDRIAQLVIERYDESFLIEVSQLDETIRAEKGFGSSGN